MKKDKKQLLSMKKVAAKSSECYGHIVALIIPVYGEC